MRLSLLLLVLAIALGACGDASDDLQREALVTYADIAHAMYEDAHTAAVDMDAAIDSFLDEPSEATLERAREAWLEAREPYSQTEAFRYSNGPIDDEDGPEGLLNAWPLDEAYIDYVQGGNGVVNTGVINRPEDFPALDAALLESLNEQGGEENVAVGYHAIEFLLWGQDLSETGAGDRPVSDYTTAPNADRRSQYLALVSDLLLVHLQHVVDAWAPEAPDAYRATFLAMEPEEALRNVFTGIATLAKSELAVERIFVAVNNQDQEDEHSCFSDNTHRDIADNMQGLSTVWYGRYIRTDGSVVSGTSLVNVVAATNPEAAGETSDQALTARLAIEAIPAPFDRAIIEDQPTVLAAVDALQSLGDAFVMAAAEIGVSVTNDLPS